MKQKRFYLIAACLLLTLATSPGRADPLKGLAPNFTLKGKSGKNIKLSEIRGQVVMLNFWASWCAPCRQEMPYLEEIYRKYQPFGFTILGVNVEEDSSKAKTLLKNIPVSFPILFDKQNKVSALYNVAAMPSTVLIDRDGNMRYLHQGYKPGYEVEYQNQVRQLVRE